MDIKEAQEIIKAGLVWADWSDEKKEAMEIALDSMSNMERFSLLENKLEILEKNPYTKIIMFLESRQYTYTIKSLLEGYQDTLDGLYVSYTMKDSINHLENELKEIYNLEKGIK